MKSPPLFTTPERNKKRDDPCPLCASPVLLKYSGQHSFWGCSAYPACSYSQSLFEVGDFEPESLPGHECPLCSSSLLLKKGRYGFFIGCSAFPECHFMADPSPVKTSEQQVSCPSCHDGLLVKRTSKAGRSFYACDQYPQCDYVLNEIPQPVKCPACGWGVMIEREGAQGRYLRCPQKSCGYRTEPL